jgi:hypothetical protein
LFFTIVFEAIANQLYQGILYLSTRTTPTSKDILEAGLSSLLQALSQDQLTPKSLFQMFYEQRDTSPAVNVEGSVVHLPSLGPDLAFHDSVMDQVRVAWDAVVKSDETVDRSSYMKFEDREGADPEEDIFD